MRRMQIKKPVLLFLALLGAYSCLVVADVQAEPPHDLNSKVKSAGTVQTPRYPAPRHEVLRDKNGFRIGEIEVKSDAHQVLRDKNGFLVGSYDPRSNQTRDKNGFLMGTGNLLTGRIDDKNRTGTDVLRDRNGFRLGEIGTGYDGRQTLRDKNGFRVGEYDPRSNQTRDKNGFLVGSGNLLPMLLEGR